MLLAVNAGSSTLKMLLQDGKDVIMKARWEKEFSRVIFKGGIISGTIDIDQKLEASTALTWILNYIKDYLLSLDKIQKVGYRYAHGGEVFVQPTEVDDEVLNKLKDIDNLSLTHNPYIRRTVEEGVKLLPKAKHILCFDTQFHSSIPMVAAMYGIDLKYYEKGVHKYGFHGLSYEYVGPKVAEILEKPFSEFSGIICHLGNGSSITAIENGKSIDTTMGFSTLDGLVMGQRSGSIDPYVIKSIMEIESTDVNGAIEILSKKSGLEAISGVSSDYRLIKDAINNKNEKAKIAIELLQYQIRKYIGSFMAILSHVDAIVFTGGIGENHPDFVESCVNTKGLKRLRVSTSVNKIPFSENLIPVLQIKTDEELAIIKTLENY